MARHPVANSATPRLLRSLQLETSKEVMAGHRRARLFIVASVTSRQPAMCRRARAGNLRAKHATPTSLTHRPEILRVVMAAHPAARLFSASSVTLRPFTSLHHALFPAPGTKNSGMRAKVMGLLSAGRQAATEGASTACSPLQTRAKRFNSKFLPFRPSGSPFVIKSTSIAISSWGSGEKTHIRSTLSLQVADDVYIVLDLFLIKNKLSTREDFFFSQAPRISAAARHFCR